jgi:hypothetical protein
LEVEMRRDHTVDKNEWRALVDVPGVVGRRYDSIKSTNDDGNKKRVLRKHIKIVHPAGDERRVTIEGPAEAARNVNEDFEKVIEAER